MAGERDDHDERIAAALRQLAAGAPGLDAPPPELWGRIAGALEVGAPDEVELVEPPADLWARIEREVQADEAAAAGSVHAPVAAGTGPPGGRGRRWWTLAASAAAVLVLLVAGAVVLAARDADPGPEVVATAALSGDGLDPGGSATGTARLLDADGTWKVSLDVADLPDPEPSTYYEAWLLGTGPDQVQSLGALEGADGFVVPDGLDLADFPLVDVSIEPIDGDPAHSARSVLRGELERQ